MNTLATNKKDWLAWVVTALIVVAMMFMLSSQGRIWICACGTVKFWVNDVWGAENSQHLFDAYSFSHLLHGVLFMGMLYGLSSRLSFSWRLALATLIEAAWELLENSEIVLSRYRETAAQGYNGDSIVNSFGDLVSCGLGFALAYYLGLKKSIILFIVVEVVMILWIKDSLLLNIIMLIYPLDFIKEWQMSLL